LALKANLPSTARPETAVWVIARSVSRITGCARLKKFLSTSMERLLTAFEKQYWMFINKLN
jgi:hypothetical protein